MAYIIQSKSMSVFTPNRLNIYHWKSLRQVDSDVEMVLNFYVYHIKDCTIDEIHEANSKDKRYQINKVSIYKWNVLTCELCSGVGVLDWLSHIMKPKVKYNIYDPECQYKRDPKSSMFKLTTFEGDHFFISSPKVNKGYERCNKCLGTGINTIRKNVTSVEELKHV